MNNTQKTIAIDIRLLGKERTGDETVFFHLTKEVLKLDRKNQYRLLTDETVMEKIASLSLRLECIGQENVSIVSLPVANRFVWNIFVLPKYLFRNKIDIFHTQYILPLFSPKWTKMVTHIHDVSFRRYPELIGWLDRLFLMLLIPRSLARATLIVTPSQFTKQEIIKYYAVHEEKITVVQNALGENFFKDAAEDTEKDRVVREKYHLPEDFIIAAGTLQPRKNIPLLVSAFASLRKRLPKMNLVLVGNRHAHHADSQIDRTIARENLGETVIFPGFVKESDLPTVIRLAQVFVLPSLYEGFGIPLLEAMSQRVPVVASDIPGLREVGGEAVAYFDPKSIVSCEERVYTLCTQEEERMALIKHGEERVRLFSWQKSAHLLLNAYNKILQ
ncbi:MAG: glycosyltransferase family 1 protein [Candidatus Moranbacteria bacterium]|nr:glycosyltransferase family 1 protein [Candidatus Moranbacteria bacterium]